jgi:tRNA-uridine 2-sulfurtransferase
MLKQNLRNKKVAIALSGGVDSGVAAAILVKAGYQCTGFHMHFWSEYSKDKRLENKCCSTVSLEAARKTAHQLGIPFYVVDFSQVFKKKVVDDFLINYGKGLTPNPCVICNKFIKFGELFNYVRKLGFDYLATGHYLQITKDFSYHLCLSLDKKKDQSYFLYNLKEKQLPYLLFPVGAYQKKEVIALAKKWKLPVANRQESQEICFLAENDYRPFLKRCIPQKIKPGEVVDLKSNVLGVHQGLPLYTIGQRHGFEIKFKQKENENINKGVIPPFYVIGKNVLKNQLIVGFGQETEIKEFKVKSLNWLGNDYQKILSQKQILVRVRHQGKLLKAKIKLLDLKAKVILFEPERGIAPGQSAIFYYQNKVLGGGVIDS